MRTATAAVLTAATFAGGLPGVAHAAPAVSPGDRAVAVVVKNHTTVRLTRVDYDVSEGDWTNEPPRVIKGLRTARFGSESTEDMGGTEASVTYRTRYGNVEIYWSDPWMRDNEFTCDAPPELTCEADGDLSARPTATYDIYES
jgi:hypothetical protein